MILSLYDEMIDGEWVATINWIFFPALMIDSMSNLCQEICNDNSGSSIMKTFRLVMLSLNIKLPMIIMSCFSPEERASVPNFLLDPIIFIDTLPL